MSEVEQAQTFTPGPWTINPIDGGPDNPTPHYEIVGRNGDEVADTIDCEAMDKANARLIAAAPDLYAFAKEFLEWAENHGGIFTWIEHPSQPSSLLAADEGWTGLVGMADEATARATGGAA